MIVFLQLAIFSVFVYIAAGAPPDALVAILTAGALFSYGAAVFLEAVIRGFARVDRTTQLRMRPRNAVRLLTTHRGPPLRPPVREGALVSVVSAGPHGTPAY